MSAATTTHQLLSLAAPPQFSGQEESKQQECSYAGFQSQAKAETGPDTALITW